MTSLSMLKELIRKPHEYARQQKREYDKNIVGFFCSYTPEELIYAAGALPFRLFGTGRNLTLADSHLQSYCCSLVKRVFNDALSGALNFLDVIVFPHTCDTIQRLSDLWRINLSFAHHIDVVLPVKLNTPSSILYFIDVLKRCKSDLERALHREITEEDIRNAINTYNQMRNLLKRFYTLKCTYPDRISGDDLYTITMASMIMDKSDVINVLEKTYHELEKNEDSSPPVTKKRIVLSGGGCTILDFYRVIEQAGAYVVGDDLCTGSRYYEGVIEHNSYPLESIAHRYINRGVCPSKHGGLLTRADSLVKLAKEKRADGVIFLFFKFCDPHAFDYPTLKKTLDSEGIPNTLIEVEDQPSVDERLQTRIEAFIEML